MGSFNEADESNDLPTVLSRIVNDPDKIRFLHGILGPFCHQSRNILNCLKLSLYLSHREGAGAGAGEGPWPELEGRYLAVEQLFDRLQTICRPLPLSLVRLPLTLLIDERRDAWFERFSARQRSLNLIPPEIDDAGDYDPNWLGQALDHFINWRAAAGRKHESAVLRWWTDQGRFHLEWTETDFGPGGDTREDRERSESFALPLLGRVISAHGGMMIVGTPGRQLIASWPQHAELHRSPNLSQRSPQ